MGGTWASQNKVRPGAYINFKAVTPNQMTTGDRGVVALYLPLSWGKENDITEVLSTDLMDGTSRKTVGITAFDTLSGDDSRSARLLVGALSYAYKALVFRIEQTGSAKATCSIDKTDADTSDVLKFSVSAKYKGTFGNKLSVKIEKDVNDIYVFYTILDGSIVDSLKLADSDDLKDYSNDYITVTLDDTTTGLTEFALTALEGGLDKASDGTVNTEITSDAIVAFKKSKWQTLACLETTETGKKTVVNLIKNLREDEGKYVQAVVFNYSADHEGIINSVSGAKIDGVDYAPIDFVSIVAGLTAGANFNKSNTAKVITGATEIIGTTSPLTDKEIKEALTKGQFVLSETISGKIKVEQDINSLIQYGQDKNYNFSKNRVIRTLDEIGTTVKQTWEDDYMGKFDNNANGRALFKADIIQYCYELERLSGIQEFNQDEITVEQGTDLDTVLVDMYVKPVDSMEKLYLNVFVNS